MSVSFDSYEAKVVENAIAMLAGSATFRALVGATTSAEAKAFIIETDGGAPEEDGLAEGDAVATDGTTFPMVPPFATVHIGDLDTALAGVGVFDYTGQVEVILRLPRTLTGENPPESTRRARNTIGGIRADIEAAFGSTGAFATGMCASEGPFLPSNTGADADAIIGILRIEFFA